MRQGMPTKALMTVPRAPNRTPPPPYGRDGFNRVAVLANVARNWLRGQQLPTTGDAVIAMTALALKEQRRLDEEVKRAAWEAEHQIEPPSTVAAKPSASAPVTGARRPVAKKGA
jgi:hypothetical protein